MSSLVAGLNSKSPSNLVCKPSVIASGIAALANSTTGLAAVAVALVSTLPVLPNKVSLKASVEILLIKPLGVALLIAPIEASPINSDKNNAEALADASAFSASVGGLLYSFSKPVLHLS